MWYGCLNSSSVYTTHIPTLRRWISSLSLSKSGSRSIQNYSFTMDPSTSRRPSGVTYRSGFARKESTSALLFSAPASRRTAKLPCFFIPITTFIFRRRGVDTMPYDHRCLRSADRGSSKSPPPRLHWLSYCPAGKRF